jgi:hypothetical protein
MNVMNDASKFRNFSDDELFKFIAPSQPHEAAKIVLQEKMTQHLIGALNENAKSANNLSRRVFWLNFILTAATVAYAAATVYQIFCR